MILKQGAIDVDYPESDGKPMGETDLHRDWMIRIFDLLRHRYRGRRVYVSSNLLVYYEQGVPAKLIVPDVFAIKDCEPSQRRVFKIWDEGKAPDVAFEVTSKSTRREDSVFKPHVFAQIGIKEFFLYDPTAEYLTPPLQGFRLQPAGYSPIEPDSAGSLECAELGLLLRLEQGKLQIRDRQTDQLLQTESEDERDARADEHGAREAAERRAAAAEAEVERLRAQLETTQRGE